ncbi:hypothetical protein HETIRDRAFT_450763 [Heterobasidion irregulare TC 32-1]|uniref:Uncharacterized protein n=1 Tax=Heterobasidion irregulare (strain TC 32-1) TaxID=747525 RepID=W4KB61_HETIT|nr:uncharacterized protein HETIRDRAFT_450763 [Heterobasidion irregulare TC 32-1]ETW83082.1 hypothetical protein HETIRDRAFT_450763 [Heterobasidion irregulare TC 32-1]
MGSNEGRRQRRPEPDPGQPPRCKPSSPSPSLPRTPSPRLSRLSSPSAPPPPPPPPPTPGQAPTRATARPAHILLLKRPYVAFLRPHISSNNPLPSSPSPPEPPHSLRRPARACSPGPSKTIR